MWNKQRNDNGSKYYDKIELPICSKIGLIRMVQIRGRQVIVPLYYDARYWKILAFYYRGDVKKVERV